MSDDEQVPLVSFVVPARDEAAHLPETLDAIEALDTSDTHEVVVVDGNSTDRTAAIAAGRGARVLDQSGGGIGAARTQGGRAARGEWLVFVDADTRLDPAFLDEMLAFLRERDLDAGTARCRVTGDPRGRVLELLYNHAFPRKDNPILPGFATVVRRDAFERVGGVPDVPSEDRAFSHALAADHAIGFHPSVLVETSARRVASAGLLGTTVRYFWLDLRMFWNPDVDATLPLTLVVAGVLAMLGALLQVLHGLTVGYSGPGGPLGPVAAATGFPGGILLYALGLARRALLGAGVAFVALQVVALFTVGPRQGVLSGVLAAVLVALAGTLAVALVRTP
jgi:hypothetical protein